MRTTVAETWKLRKFDAWCGLLGVLLLPVTVLGAGPVRIEKTFDTTANPHVTVLNLIGHVAVKGWDKPQVHLTSITGSPSVDVQFAEAPPEGQGPAGALSLTTHILDAQSSGAQKSADYTLDIPSSATLEIRNPEGSVRIDSIRGSISVYAVGGNISVVGASGHLSVRSIGGDIEVVRASGRVEANSVCGALRFIDPSSDSLEAQTYSGRIFYQGGFLPGGEYKLRNFSGDVEVLTTSPACSFVLNAKTTRGKVRRELGSSKGCESSPRIGEGFLSTRANKATVDLTSFSGLVHVVHQ